MIPWQLIDRAKVPKLGSSRGQGLEICENSKLVLYQRGEEFSIRVDNWELMNSRSFGSEQEIASVAYHKLLPAALAPEPGAAKPCLLVGGLGMGFTLRTALDLMPENSRVVIAELVPDVVRWNQKHIGHLAEHPLRDPRVEVVTGDVAALIRSQASAHDAIVLDVDNGPHSKSTESEGWLYSHHGLEAIHRSLRPHGVLSIWSAGSCPGFTAKIEKHGFKAEELRCRGRGGKGNRHRIWLAQRSS